MALQKGWAPVIANAATITGAHQGFARALEVTRASYQRRLRLRLRRCGLDLVAADQLLDLLGQVVDLRRQLLQIVVRREIQRATNAIDDLIPGALELRRNFVDLSLHVADRGLR